MVVNLLDDENPLPEKWRNSKNQPIKNGGQGLPGFYYTGYFSLGSLQLAGPTTVGNEGGILNLKTAWYIGDETTLIPYFSGQLVNSLKQSL